MNQAYRDTATDRRNWCVGYRATNGGTFDEALAAYAKLRPVQSRYIQR